MNTLPDPSPDSPDSSVTTAPERPAEAGPKVDRLRRRLGTAGMTGTAVLLSSASRSAIGGWGQCTGSELASGNLSRKVELNACGCSPGYWWNMNGIVTWDKYIPTTYARTTKTFNMVFGMHYFASNVVLNNCGPSSNNPRAFLPNDNGLNNVAMHAVAALLNASFYGARFPVIGLQTPAAVISAFQTAFGAETGRATRLKDFVARVDVYNSANTWCVGSDHGGLTLP